MAELNGEPAVLAWRQEILLGVIVFELTAGQIRALRMIANPAKLTYVARQIVAVSRSAALAGS